jgi:hypothetical protein
MADDGSGRRDLAVYATLACGDAPVDTFALTPNTEGQKTAQREIATALETAFDARRQRIIISQSHVNLVKWLYGSLLPIAVGLFATGVAASVLLIAAHDRPFTGKISVGPGPLLQVMPDASR